jgi:outer membrane protein assembly factor BamE (lipoprotein component of BamABCDE complex)
MGKRLFLLGVAIVAVALAFTVTDSLLVTLTAGVTEANVRRIRVGMSKPQVDRILGRPQAYESLPRSRQKGLWVSGSAEVEVIFDGDGNVRSAYFYRTGEAESLMILWSKSGWCEVFTDVMSSPCRVIQ